MNFSMITSFSSVGLFLALLAFYEVGRRLGVSRLARNSEGLPKGVSAAEGAVFGLLGLLLAFTFSGAASRFEARRHLIVEEANAIGTAYLRLDLLPADAQPEIRELFRKYLDARMVVYQDAEDMAGTQAKLAAGAAMQAEIWSKAITACRRPDASSQATMLLFPALNAMIDITATRQMATQNHPPLVVFLLLAAFSLVGALLVGHATSPNRKRSWFHVVVFALILSLTVYVIIDLEFPRLGFIRVHGADQALLDVRKMMD